MAFNEGFAFAYGWNVYYQKLLGMWTIYDEGLIVSRRAWACSFVIFVTICLPQMASMPIVWGDLTAMIGCMVMNISFSISIVKIMVLQYRKKVIRSFLVEINEDWGRESTKEELEVMLDTGRISRFISILSFSLTSIVIAAFMALQIWNKANNVKAPKTDPRLTNDFLFVVYYPFDTTRRSVFMAILSSQFLGTIMGPPCYAASDSLLSMLVLHVCGQLRIIRNSMENVVNETLIREPKKYWTKLAVVVKRHDELNKLAIAINSTFSSVLLIQMFACSVTFCLQSFLIFTAYADRNGVQIPIVEIGYSMVYAAYTLTHLFIHCYVGDRLFVESTSVANNFYKAEWYNLSPREAKAFLHVSQRSKNPLEITAGQFCTFNLQLFNTVLKNSMSYFSMLVAMKERLVD